MSDKLKLFGVWKSMKNRCYNKKVKAYKNYGERGITVCKSWLESFDSFVLDIGEKPEGSSLDRINNDKGYSKDNCRWATRLEQANNKRNNVNVTVGEKTMSASQWQRETGACGRNIRKRISRGWDAEHAVSPEHRANRKRLPFKGKYLTIDECSEETGIKSSTIKTRLSRGWSESEALGKLRK
jgi:hypothetical protein